MRKYMVYTSYEPRRRTHMTKTLTKHGNSYALVIDKPILELIFSTP